MMGLVNYPVLYQINRSMIYLCQIYGTTQNRNKALAFQFSSVTQSCQIYFNPMDCSTPGLPVHHQLLEFTKTHANKVGDAIQSSHSLLSPSPSAFNLSQHEVFLQ